MNRMLQRLLATAFATGIFILLSAPKKPSPVDLSLVNLEGQKVHLKDYRGKAVVLNFWATWCGPCKEEMPMFVQVEKEWAPKGIVFIGASLDEKDTVKNIPPFAQKFQIGFSIWKGATGDDLYRLGLGETVPGTAFIDEAGIVFARVQGQIKLPELLERLQWITSDRTGPAPKALVRNL